MSKHRVSSEVHRIARAAVCALLFAACGSSGGGDKTGAAGSSGGAGSMGAAGTSGGAGSGSTAGSSGGGVAGAGGSSAAGTSGAAGAAGSSGTAGGAGTMGGAGSGGGGGAGAAGQGGSSGAAGGTAGTSGAAGTMGSAGAGGAAGPFALTSSAFTAGMEIPLEYKCTNVPPAGMNHSPPLSWTPGPSGTKSYAITFNHNPTGDNSAHWALWDIPATTTSIAANVEHVAMPSMPAGSKQTNQNLDGFVGIGYQGPCPQAPNSRQTYRFTVWAIGVATLGANPTMTKDAQTAIKNAALPNGSATLDGTQIQTP
jgi:Raf kinase inhibitor-like YbhB/YbcL family protein